MAQSDLSQQQQDEALLQKFGYKQELRRSLGFISNFAVAFSYISVSTGTFSLFYLGILAGGPAFFWTWFIVAIGQFIVALNFAELASHFPIAGSIYQWSKRLSGFTLGWFTGWIYFFAGVLTITAVAFTVPIPLLAIFPGIPATILGLNNAVFIALLSIVIGTIINVLGVRLVSIVNNIGVAAEIIGMFVFALVLLIFFNHQSLGFLFTGPTANVAPQVLQRQCSCRCSSSTASTQQEHWARKPMTRRGMRRVAFSGLLGFQLSQAFFSWAAPSFQLRTFPELRTLRLD